MLPPYQGVLEQGQKGRPALCFLVPILQLLHPEAVVGGPELVLGLHVSCLSSDSTVQAAGLALSYNPSRPKVVKVQHTFL